jgi:hypothetical protein
MGKLKRVLNNKSNAVHVVDRHNPDFTICGIQWKTPMLGEFHRYSLVSKETKCTCHNCGHGTKHNRTKMTAEENTEFIEWNRRMDVNDLDGIDDIDPLGILDDDMSDGAYWAMWQEVYGGGW